jgi:hypothetical protein
MAFESLQSELGLFMTRIQNEPEIGTARAVSCHATEAQRDQKGMCAEQRCRTVVGIEGAGVAQGWTSIEPQLVGLQRRQISGALDRSPRVSRTDSSFSNTMLTSTPAPGSLVGTT